mgnify:CR=1 FL=1
MNLGDLLLSNPFKNSRNNKNSSFVREKEKREKELEELENKVKRDIKIFAEEAKELFQDQRYTKLKNEFKKILEQNTKLLINYDESNGDINKYVFKMRGFQMQLRILEQIFNTPEGFVTSNDRIGNEEEERD